MIKQTFHFDELKCHDCALTIVEKIEDLDYINSVYIDYDNNNITIESEISISRADVENLVHEVVTGEHEVKHSNYFNNMQNIVTDEFNVEKLDPEKAIQLEKELNKDKDIVEATVNYVNKKVIIKHLNNVEIYNIASKIIGKTNQGAVITKVVGEEHDHESEHHDNEHEHEHKHKHHKHKHTCECGCHHHHHEHIDGAGQKKDLLCSEDELRNGICVSVFHFEEIDCANCAAQVEMALNKNADILEANINFVQKTITVKHYSQIDAKKIVQKTLKHLEPDAYLVDDNDGLTKEKSKAKQIITIIGVVLFLIGLVIMHIGDEEITEVFGFEPLFDEKSFFIIMLSIFIPSYICLAYDLIYKSIVRMLHGDVFNESLLMVVASMGALALSFFGELECVEACAVILLYKIGEHYQDRATEKSKRAIKELIDMKKDTVTLKDGTVKSIKEVTVGEVITIKAGEQIPLDGILISKDANLDTKALTGESMPVYAMLGEEILSGSINLTKVIDVEVTKEDSESTITKVLKLVEEATNQKSKSEQFITKFARIYTPSILFLAITIAIVEIITGFGVPEGVNVITGALNNMFSMLVISCPCALVISIPLSYFAGIGRFSASGILVKGGNYIEALSNAKTFVFDKTGTITKGNFKVSEVSPCSPYSKDQVLEIIAQVEQFSMHPIANSIKEAYQKKVKKVDNARVEEISGAGIKMIVNNKIILVGNSRLMKTYHIMYIPNKNVGTVLYLSVDNEFYGSVLIKDEIKDESAPLIQYLNKKHLKSIMLTGDNEEVAKSVSETLGIKEYKSKLLPYEKFEYLESLIKNGKGKVAYIGDGINDTPAIRRADIGIAMGGSGSDSAKECADIVIMNDDISKVIDAIQISKYTKTIILENIIFALGVKFAALIISVLGILSQFGMVIALFADVGVCIIAILNTLRILAYKRKGIKKPGIK